MRICSFVSAILCLVLIGCQRPAKSDGEAPVKGAKLKIVFIPKNSGNPYFAAMEKGFADASKELGAEFTSVAPSTGEATSQIPIIKDQIQRKVDVIAISPNSPDALNEVLDEARDQGILVITADADLAGNESRRVASVLPTDFDKLGESQVALLGSQIGYEGEIAILSATRDAPNQNMWIEGMKATLKQPKYAKMKLVEVVYGDDVAEKSATETEALLAKYPNLRGIIAPTSAGLPAAAKSLEIAGVYPGGPNAKAGVFLTGLSTPNPLKDFVAKGVVQAFQLWSPYDMGKLACYMAYQIKTGKVKPGEGVEFEAPGLGKRTFGKNNVVSLGPLTTFTKENIASFDF